MKTLLTAFVAAGIALASNAAVTIEKPVNTAGCPTSFAIVTDNTTYNAVRPSLLRYRDAVETDGLATWIVRDDWKSPSEVRDALKDLYARDPRLEGIVIVGDVPVAMVRNAQHTTTAFKMDEDKFPFLDSSVPSDRFYDCLDLEFRYLSQDTTHSHLFYYELAEDCPQRLSPTFYSARVRYPAERGGDKYEGIAMFFDKAAAAKKDLLTDRVDRVVSFNGHGYNGDCLIAWMDEEKAYREHFPEAFKRSTDFKHWNFRMLQPMKHRLFSELERPGIDVFMFHEHGGPQTQYINGFGESTELPSRLKYFKSDLYSYVTRQVKRGKDESALVADLCKEYSLTPQFFADLHNEQYLKADSAERAAKDMYADEFHARITMPRFVMFDACYNGSFHEDDYIAGEYIFNPGGTLVTQGNTRNVLQDRWTIEMIGLLSHGVRVGNYNRMVATLEGHLVGDPTVRFAPVDPATATISADITLRKEDAAYWNALLASPSAPADVQSLALRMLCSIEPQSVMSPRLLEVYRTSPFNTTRMEAMRMLARYSNDDFREAVRLGVNDPYERIARMAAAYAGGIGDPSLLPDVVAAYIDGNERARVNYTLSNSLGLFPREEVLNEIDIYYARTPRFDAESEKSKVLTSLERTFRYAAEYNGRISDTSASDDKRISSIRFVRNNPYHQEIDRYLTLLADDSVPDNLRVNMAEALGWFVNSYRKTDILDGCRQILKQENLPDAVAAEIRQTVNRLN